MAVPLSTGLQPGLCNKVLPVSQVPVVRPTWVVSMMTARGVTRLEPLARDARSRGHTCCRATLSAAEENGAAAVAQAKPVVKIDNQHDPFATVVTIQFGDVLGELLDTTAALKNLGLNIKRAKLRQSPDGTKVNKFYITDARTSEKILKSARLEEIRLTILNNMLSFHPESGEYLGFGPRAVKPSTRDFARPLGPKNRMAVSTTIEVTDPEDQSYSVVYIETMDRPGLLTDIVRVLKDINVNVVSAEVDTEGNVAKDSFYVTYHGESLNPPMVQLVTNALQYYLSLAEVEKEESY